MKIELTLNGVATSVEAHPGELLVDMLRRESCFSVKRGCQDGNCGTCVVQWGDEAVNACLVLAAQVNGGTITTCEGLGTPRSPHPIQRHYVRTAAVQCGFCTPGLIMSTKALLDRVPQPSDAEIREALDGNICRCTGYVKILEAVHDAAGELKDQEVAA